MKKILLLIPFLPCLLWADPRFPLPRNPSEIWQNDLDLRDDIVNAVSTHSLSSTYLTTSSAAATYVPLGTNSYISSQTAAAHSFPASTVYGDLVSISLDAGDWDISGVLYAFVGNLTSDILIGISQTAGNSSAGLIQGHNRLEDLKTNITGGIVSLSIPNYRQSLSATTTIYLKYACITTGAIPTGWGRLSAIPARD